MKKVEKANKQKGIIAATHQKGGVGKSTLIWNLALLYSKQQPVNLIDLDVQKTLTRSLENRELNFQPINNINVLNIRDKNDKIDDKLMLELMMKSEEEGKLLFVDCGGFDSDANRIAMAASNILLTPVSAKFFELLGLQTFELILKQLTEEFRGAEKLIANVVLNKINPNVKKLNLGVVSDFINNSDYFNLMETVVRQRVDFEDSPGLGQGVVEFNKDGEAAREILQLKKEIDNILKTY